MSGGFHALVVSETRQEIGGLAKTVVFDVPDRLKATFAWRAGQHLSLRFNINGREERRSYSISASPASAEPLQITVKRVRDGLVSNHIVDTVEKGDVIEVVPPFGTFCLDAASNLRRTHYLFAAGSGITPLYAMLHSVLCHEPHSFVCLAHGNRSADTILLRSEIDDLAKTHSDRISVNHVLSAPSMWSGFDYWRKGTIDKHAIEALISENPPYAQDAQYYVCGPGAMNTSVKTALMSLDVPASRIHLENYGGATEIDDRIKGIAATANITLNGIAADIRITENQNVLQAARNAGINPPFSCQSGVCGACRAELRKGSVHMRATMALDDADIERGYILTCQSVATSKNLSITYR